ncbi:MAG: N-acetylmuramoyl-L-alanine amidase [Clostridia bacterium]|nr:N-acetylmuramoyl-L-alanine amidase [Clostridia bacterium]
MFITVRRSSILMVLLILCVACGIYGLYAEDGEQVFQNADQLTVVIDAGHGGMDGGAVGISGVLEKDLNLQVAKKLEKLVTDGGGKALMTRADDVSLHTDQDKTVREQKRSDLNYRRSYAADSGADAFISIHMNKFEQSQYRGAQIFYAADQDSKQLAEMIKKNIVPVSEKSDGREIKKAYDTMFILQQSKLPSVIVECGFLSNSEEEALLTDDAYQQKIAEAIYRGLCEFLQEKRG